MENEATTTPNKKPSRKRLLAIGAAVLAVAAIIAALAVLKPSVSFNVGPKDLTEMTDAQRSAYAEKIKAQVAKHMLLPAETPQITAAADSLSDLLARGGFWKDIEKGDLILVFTEEPRVIIWRPSKKLIINVGPIINTDTAN